MISSRSSRRRQVVGQLVSLCPPAAPASPAIRPYRLRSPAWWCSWGSASSPQRPIRPRRWRQSGKPPGLVGRPPSRRCSQRHSGGGRRSGDGHALMQVRGKYFQACHRSAPLALVQLRQRWRRSGVRANRLHNPSVGRGSAKKAPLSRRHLGMINRGRSQITFRCIFRISYFVCFRGVRVTL